MQKESTELRVQIYFDYNRWKADKLEDCIHLNSNLCTLYSELSFRT